MSFNKNWRQTITFYRQFFLFFYTGKKKKLSITKQGSSSDNTKAGRGKEKKSKAQTLQEETEKGGIKRSRSQRSVADVERGIKYYYY